MKTALFVLTAFICLAQADTKIDLSGTWQFALDKQDQGIEQKWFAGDLKTTDTIHLPGSLQSQGYGDIPGPSTPWTGNIQQTEWDKSKYAPWRTTENF